MSSVSEWWYFWVVGRRSSLISSHLRCDEVPLLSHDSFGLQGCAAV